MTSPGTRVAAELVVAYAATDYRVTGTEPAFVLRIGHHNVALAECHHRYGVASSAFITAWNPGSQPRPIAENETAQRRLRNELEARGLPVLAGEGIDIHGQWPAEPSLLVLGISAHEAHRLAVRYDQHAIVFAGADAVPTLIWGCELPAPGV